MARKKTKGAGENIAKLETKETVPVEVKEETKPVIEAMEELVKETEEKAEEVKDDAMKAEPEVKPEEVKPEGKEIKEVKEKPVKEKKGKTVKEKTVKEKEVIAKKEKPTKTKKEKPVAEKKEKEEKPEKKTAAKTEAVKANIMLQFNGKSYSNEDLIKIAKDVWKYDLKGKAKDFKSVDLYVKPEEDMVYFVINGEVSGSFAI